MPLAALHCDAMRCARCITIRSRLHRRWHLAWVGCSAYGAAVQRHTCYLPTLPLDRMAMRYVRTEQVRQRIKKNR